MTAPNRPLTDLAADGDPPDGQLLARYVTGRDEAAFALLVRRHGPTVMGVCRRVLRDPQDADDAFQATFLVLVRKAASVARPDRLGNWLYGVASRAAWKANAAAARRSRVPPPADVAGPDPAEDLAWGELRPLLDAEVNRLPAKYREPFVLCYLEGRTHEEVARRLGCPRATVTTRLVRARERLRSRLTRRGLALTAAGLAALLDARTAPAAVPPALVASTVRAAGGAPSASAAALTHEVLRAMKTNRLKTAAVALLTATVLGLGAGAAAYLRAEPPPAAKPAGDLGQLQGTWVLESQEFGGQKQDLTAEEKKATLVIKGDQGTLTTGDRAMTATVKLGEAKKPKEIDLIIDEGGGAETHLGIYHLDGDTLRICKSHPPQGRPTEFATKAGDRWPLLIVLKRKK